MKIEWRRVGIAPEYEVSSEGEIRSSYTNRPLVGGLDKDGYRKLVLCTGGGRKYARVASLVCEAFHGPCPDGCGVRHLDGCRVNNAASNLAWGTQKENIADKRRHGTDQRGERHPRSILDDDAVRQIRGRLGASAKDLAEEFGVKPCAVYAVRSGRAWRHVK